MEDDHFDDVKKTIEAFLSSRQMKPDISAQHSRATKVQLYRDLAKSGMLSDDWIEYTAGLIQKDVQTGSTKQRGRKRNENLLRDANIADAVHLGVTLGLTPTRNNATIRPSACSVVADLLGMGEASVQKIWGKSRFVGK